MNDCQDVVDVVNKSHLKRRSLSDCSIVPSLSPSPKFRETAKLTSQDDIHLDSPSPSTPRRSSVLVKELNACLPSSIFPHPHNRPSQPPPSPKLDHSTTYASPTSVIPRRSRGMDFSRAATNLHHSILAEQPSPESSPVLGRAINIPLRKSASLQSNNDLINGAAGSLWSSMASAERSAISSSVGSVNMVEDSSTSSSDDDDLMDADEIDDTIINTPQMSSAPFGTGPESPAIWSGAPSPAVNGFMNFQRHKMRAGKERRHRSNLQHSHMTRSPPMTRRELSVGIQRRDSISWAANQLHISGSESDDNPGRKNSENDGSPSTPSRDGQRGVVKRVVTRRGNMLPKPKGFARIRAALAEEGAPVENETRREADVIRQVREADPVEEHEPKYPPSTAHSSPIFGPALSEALDDIPESDIMVDDHAGESALTAATFRQQLMRNSTAYWNAQEDHYKTTPPQTFRAPASTASDDTNMESPSLGNALMVSMPSIERTDTMSSSGRSSTPHNSLSHSNMPSAADITRKVNNKRRRDDDFDPSSFKRRAVSPGMSVHNSPVLQSPMQKDVNPWGTRPSIGGVPGLGDGKSNENLQHKGSLGSGTTMPPKRVGLQGMVDTHDGLMKMSIE